MLPAAPRQQDRSLPLAFLLVAAAFVAARLPFLLHGSRFFDSDEAVEGLMARHVLAGEFPFFLWGQRYKGVPEVYLAAAVFRAWAPGVIALKAVTLACCAVYACLNFSLLTRLFSRRLAWIATAFLIAGPPSLVQWTLSGSAEIVMTFLAGTAMLLGLVAWKRTGSRAGLVTAAASLGFGLWIQQFILYYVAAIAVAAIDWTPQGRARLRALAGGGITGWLQIALGLPVIMACIYGLLGVAAFLGLGFAIDLFGVPISVTAPQKMWWIAGGFLLIAAGGLTAVRLTRDRRWGWWVAPALGFLAGYSPAIAGRFLSEGYGAPLARMDLAGLTSTLPQFVGVALPIVLGFKGTGTETLAVPGWMGFVLAAVVVVSYVRMARDAGAPLTRVFHIFLVLAPVLFIVSGSYIDAQSYRYLMPLHAALPAVYAVGIDSVLRANRIAGILLLSGLVTLFGLQQADWYRRLAPDRDTAAIIACLERSGVRAAYADYWLSYKLTFLTAERVIVAPTTGVDRYPAYTAVVRSQPSAPTIARPASNATDPASDCRTVVRHP